MCVSLLLIKWQVTVCFVLVVYVCMCVCMLLFEVRHYSHWSPSLFVLTCLISVHSYVKRTLKDFQPMPLGQVPHVGVRGRTSHWRRALRFIGFDRLAEVKYLGMGRQNVIPHMKIQSQGNSFEMQDFY